MGTEHVPAVESTRAPAAAATLTTATTGVVVWVVQRFAFHGNIPPEVFGFLQFGVPAVLGWVGGWITHRRQLAHREET